MRGVVDLRAGEHRATFAALFSLMGITGAHTMLETARDALFLSKLPPSRLPWVYLAIALAGLILARLAKRGGGKKSKSALSLSLVGAAAITLAFWGLTAGASTAMLYALYVWTGIFASWVVLQLWMLLGAVFTVAQAKRLFGFIGAGGVLGAVVGAAAARALAGMLPARHLLLAGAVLLVLTAIGPAPLLRAPPVTPTKARSDAAPKATGLGADVRDVVRDPYVKRILALILASTVALTTVDYLFKASVAAEIPKEQLGEYFAGVYVVLNAIALFVQLVVVGFVFRVVGVQRALWGLPVLLMGGSVAVLLGGGLTAALLLKGADGTLKHSLHKTSTELLFVPIPDQLRPRVKPVIDLIGQRGGQALASVTILVLVTLGVEVWQLALLVGGFVAVWLVVAATIQRPYLNLFRKALAEGRIEQSPDLPDLDLASLEALFAGLNSPKDAEVIGALDLLAAQKRQRLIPALILYHPSKAIVLRALDLFVAEERDDYLPITDRLLEHADPEVRAAALRARAASTRDEALLRDRLADDVPEVRATALCTLLARKWEAQRTSQDAGEDLDLGWLDELETRLDELVADPSPAVRIALARAIEVEPSERFEPALLTMARRPGGNEPEVDVAIAAAMGRVGCHSFFDPLIGMFAFREQGHAARDALVQMGPPALEYLDRAIADGSLPRQVRWKLPRAVSRFEPALAAPVLLSHLKRVSEGMVRFRILRGLKRLRREDPDLELDHTVLDEAALTTLRSAYALIADRRALERAAEEEPLRRTPAQQLLVTLLSDKEKHAVGRLFHLLGLLYPKENFERMHRGLSSDSAKTRAASRELLENVLTGALKAPIMTLVDELPDDERLTRAGTFHEAKTRSYEALLAELHERAGELSSLTAYHAAEVGVELSPTDAGADEGDALSAGLDALAPPPISKPPPDLGETHAS